MADVDIDAIIAQLMDEVARSSREGGRSGLTERTYADQPIIRRGSDLAREREEHAAQGRTQERVVQQAGRGETGPQRNAGQRPPQQGAAGPQQGRPWPRADQRGATDRQPNRQDPPRQGGGTPGLQPGSYHGQPRPTGEGDAARPSTSRTPEPSPYPPQAYGTGRGRNWRYTGGPTRGRAASRPAPEAEAAWEGLGVYGSPRPRHVDLPPTLRELRDLERETDEGGQPLHGPALFLRQARLAQSFADDWPYQGVPTYHYQPTYRTLSDEELRGYFTWRAAWRRGERDGLRLRTTHVLLLAFELVAGVASSPAADPFAELADLRDACRQADADGLGPGVSSDLSNWARDYAICHGLDAGFAVTGDERAFGHAVATLRQAERAIECAEGLHGLGPADAPAMPGDAEVWAAMGALSSYSPGHSPFLRTHEEAAAAVGAGVFRRLVVHCAKRRKTDYVDGLVGHGSLVPYRPYLGVPVEAPSVVPGLPIELTESQRVVERHGRLWLECAYDRAGKSRDLGKVLRGIDRQMRIDWDFSRPLKERPLPRYLQTMVEKESAARHEAEAVAERRRIRIDISQLGRIREAAATTREALLVDEEREGYVPAGETLAESGGPVPVAVPEAAPPPQAVAPSPEPAANPCGLTDAQLAFARAVLAGTPAPLPPGTTPDLMVDAVNEALFDELGDSAFEFGDDGPQPVEDYLDDLRDLLG